MSNVFANGLEISGKAVGAKTIAAFPDVCFTPPENPATPPGVPVPYPSFGMAGDTENGTGTVFIGGKTVNIKNKSDLSKTSGTEAGCAAKKGAVSSKNTGKSFFNSWSPNVKFEDEPVIRNTDLATHNHGSPTNTGPWVHVAGVAIPKGACEKVFSDLDGHQHSQSPCESKRTGRESEHTSRAAAFLHTRRAEGRPEVKCAEFPNYDEGAAPCICMNAARVNRKKNERMKKEMDHDRKTRKEDTFLSQYRSTECMSATGSVTAASCAGKCTRPTTGALTEEASKATARHHSRTKRSASEEKQQIAECLELINLAYIAGASPNDSDEEINKKIEAVKKKPICGKGVCKSKTKPCFGCGS